MHPNGLKSLNRLQRWNESRTSEHTGKERLLARQPVHRVGWLKEPSFRIGSLGFGEMKMKTRLVAILLYCLLSFTLVACNFAGTPTQDPAQLIARYDQALADYAQIEIGMPYDQVEEIIGFPGMPADLKPPTNEATESIPPASSSFGYQWKFGEDQPSITYHYGSNEHTTTGTKTFSCFVFDRAYREDAISTEEKYDLVENGMTYDQVKAIMGSMGRLSLLRDEIRIDQLNIVYSNKGLPSAEISTRPYQWKVYQWWTDDKDISAKSLMIGFTDGMVSQK